MAVTGRCAKLSLLSLYILDTRLMYTYLEGLQKTEQIRIAIEPAPNWNDAYRNRASACVFRPRHHNRSPLRSMGR